MESFMIWVIWITVFTSIFLFAYGFIVEWGRRQRVKVRVGTLGSVPDSTLLPGAPGAKEKTSQVKAWMIQGLKTSGEWALPDQKKAPVVVHLVNYEDNPQPFTIRLVPERFFRGSRLRCSLLTLEGQKHPFSLDNGNSLRIPVINPWVILLVEKD